MNKIGNRHQAWKWMKEHTKQSEDVLTQLKVGENILTKTKDIITATGNYFAMHRRTRAQ